MIKQMQEVEAFLSQFKVKMSIFGIVFVGRGKNAEALRMLGITEHMRMETLKTIEASDYVETLSDELSYGDMWVFGKDAFDNEIYIKIAMGHPNSNTICVSFHKAEHTIKYAFKDGENG